jgi:outer membrane protein assembly factor BamB
VAAIAVVGAAVAVVVTDLEPSDDHADDVALPEEEDLQADPTAPTPESGPPPDVTPPDLELTCLVDEPCERWRTDIGALEPQHALMSVLPLPGDHLLVQGRRGVAVLDPHGDPRWSRVLEESIIEMGVPVDDEILLATDDQRLHLLGAADGARRWSVDAEVAVTAGPGDGFHLAAAVASGDLLLTLLRDNASPAPDEPSESVVRVHDRRDGRLVWQEQRTSQLQLTRGRVLVVEDERLVGLDARDGSPHWEVELPVVDAQPTEDVMPMGPHVAAVFDGTRVLVSSPGPDPDRGALLLDAATGEELATFEGATLPTTRPDDDLLVLAGAREEDGVRSLTAVDREGDTVWSRQLESLADEGGQRQSGRAHRGSWLLETASATPGEQRFRLLDLRDGEVRHEGDWEDGRPLRPLGADAIEVEQDDGGVAAVAIDDGSRLWHLEDHLAATAQLPARSSPSTATRWSPSRQIRGPARAPALTDRSAAPVRRHGQPSNSHPVPRRATSARP